MSAEMRLDYGLMEMAVRCMNLDPPVFVEDYRTRKTMWLVEVISRSSFTPPSALLSVKGLGKEWSILQLHGCKS